MAFTEAQVEAWDPQAWLLSKVDEIQRDAHVFERRSAIPGVEKKAWHDRVVKQLVATAAWFTQVAGGEGFSRAEFLDLPSARTKAGKALTAEAQRTDPEDWLVTRVEEASGDLRFFVTIGRRAEGRDNWTKAQRRLSNKGANALVLHRSRMETLLADYRSRMKPDEGGD